jgi:DNA-binding transcriptional MocR family regulator
MFEQPQPPYQEVAAELRRRISDATYPPGAQLPTRAELCNEFGFAQMTVGRAIELLRDEGLVVSRPGRGVFVRTASGTASVTGDRTLVVRFTGIADDDYKNMALAVWMTMQCAADTRFDFAVEHDGDRRLARQLNTLWSDYGRVVRWPES